MADGVWRGLPPISMEELRTILAEAPPERSFVGFMSRVGNVDARWLARREMATARIERALEARPGPAGIVSVLPSVFHGVDPRCGDTVAAELAAIRARHRPPHAYIDEALRRGDALLRVIALEQSGRLPGGAFRRLAHLLNPFRPLEPPADPEATFGPLSPPGLVALRPWLERDEAALWSVLGPEFDSLAEALGRRPR